MDGLVQCSMCNPPSESHCNRCPVMQARDEPEESDIDESL